MRAIVVSLTAAACICFTQAAKADDNVSAQRGVITLPGTVVHGRLPTPTVAVEIDRIAPKLASAETTLPLLDRIEGAVYDAIF